MQASLHQLNHEWAELVSATDVSEWVAECDGLAGCCDLADFLVAIRRSPDEVLGYLLRRYHGGDQIAGRVVLQTMLPKVLLEANRSGGSLPFDDLLSSMWLEIQGYPLERRPRAIAANLWMDMKKKARKLWGPDQECAGGLAVGEFGGAVTGGGALEVEGFDGLSAGVVLGRALERGLISRRVFELLTAVYDEGLRADEVGDRLGVSGDVVRSQCSRTIRRVLAPARLELAA